MILWKVLLIPFSIPSTVFTQIFSSLLKRKRIATWFSLINVAVIKSDKDFHTACHMKETNTGCYTPFSACIPKSNRLAAMKSLFNRAFKNSYQKAALNIHSLFYKKWLFFADHLESQTWRLQDAKNY